VDIKNTKNGAKTCILRLKQGIGAFLQENKTYTRLSARNRGLKPNYVEKQKVYSIKLKIWTSGIKTIKSRV
jgi:hypothetical protein